MKALAAHRHHRYAPLVLLVFALLVTGTVYSLVTAKPVTAEQAPADAAAVTEGHKLFLANCATCHGLEAEGTAQAPSLIGVGAAAVDFQVTTGRMPMQMDGPQAEAKPAQFNRAQINQLAAYVASLGPGPSIPKPEMVDPELGDISNGFKIFSTNCAMCHGAIGAGGALSEGKYAPSLMHSTPTEIWEAMRTGPQNMPVFNQNNIDDEEARDVIAFLVDQRQGAAGGADLGFVGPVSEAVWIWIIGMGLLIGAAVWIGAKSS